MIKRIYIHNFRCLENFELPISGLTSLLLIGKNGAGKSSVGFALQVLQSIARGTNRVGQLVNPKDFARHMSDVPIRFEIEVGIDGRSYEYVLALELPTGFKERSSLSLLQVNVTKIAENSGNMNYCSTTWMSWTE